MAGRVVDLAGDAELLPLWAAAHRRLSKGNVTPSTRIVVPDATHGTRRAVDRLLGRRPGQGRELAARVDALDAVLANAGTNLAAVVASACGPVVDQAEQRRARQDDLAHAWATIRAHPAAVEPPLAAWLDAVHRNGQLNRIGGAGAVLAGLDVLAILPTDHVGRSVLAATVVGDEHGLDDGQATARIVLAGLAARLGTEPPTTAQERAALWASAGVRVEGMSAPALTLNLRPLPAGPLTEAALRWADADVPLPIPVRAVTAERWRVPPGTVVSVCENPSVLEAAARAGSRQPLICVDGMPGRAVTLLLDHLAAGGAPLRYHGDFGTGGITIANLIWRRHAAEPWRMGTGDHRRAVERLTEAGRRPNQLRGRVPDAAWDADLRAAIVAYGYEVTEEHVLDDLLSDLT